jgi:hypothetical protein
MLVQKAVQGSLAFGASIDVHVCMHHYIAVLVHEAVAMEKRLEAEMEAV